MTTYYVMYWDKEGDSEVFVVHAFHPEDNEYDSYEIKELRGEHLDAKLLHGWEEACTYVMELANKGELDRDDVRDAFAIIGDHAL